MPRLILLTPTPHRLLGHRARAESKLGSDWRVPWQPGRTSPCRRWSRPCRRGRNPYANTTGIGCRRRGSPCRSGGSSPICSSGMPWRMSRHHSLPWPMSNRSRKLDSVQDNLSVPVSAVRAQSESSNYDGASIGGSGAARSCTPCLPAARSSGSAAQMGGAEVYLDTMNCSFGILMLYKREG